MQLYYIDGYNVIHHSSYLRPLAESDFETARDELIEKVAHYCGAKNIRAKIVFDGRGQGAPRPEAHPRVAGVEIVYSSKHQSADTLIERAVYQSGDKRELIVVTADRGIRDQCMGMGALVMSPENFLRTVYEGFEDISHRISRSQTNRDLGLVEDRLSDESRRTLEGFKDPQDS